MYAPPSLGSLSNESFASRKVVSNLGILNVGFQSTLRPDFRMLRIAHRYSMVDPIV